MLKEFKDFAMRGNAVDLAVGFILGGAFCFWAPSAVALIAFPSGTFHGDRFRATFTAVNALKWAVIFQFNPRSEDLYLALFAAGVADMVLLCVLSRLKTLRPHGSEPPSLRRCALVGGLSSVLGCGLGVFPFMVSVHL